MYECDATPHSCCCVQHLEMVFQTWPARQTRGYQLPSRTKPVICRVSLWALHACHWSATALAAVNASTEQLSDFAWPQALHRTSTGDRSNSITRSADSDVAYRRSVARSSVCAQTHNLLFTMHLSVQISCFHALQTLCPVVSVLKERKHHMLHLR